MSLDFDELMKQAGVRLGDLKADAYKKLKAEKAKMDTETRRKTRAFWGGVAVVASVLSFCLGAWIF